jgi:hypothetical protein
VFEPARVGVGEWEGQLIVSVNMNYPQSFVESIWTFRDEVHAKIRGTLRRGFSRRREEELRILA